MNKNDLEYLNHVLRNNIQLMAADCKHIENCLKTMMKAMKKFLEALPSDDDEEPYP